jgi:selenocysteine lyase/cysteine desulfurase
MVDRMGAMPAPSPGVPYLDHAATSWPKPEPVRAAVAGALAAPPSAWSTSVAEAEVARAVGARPDALLFTPGCTSALHLGVADHPWRRGDALLLDPYAHLALERPARALEARGVAVEVLTPGSSEEPLDLAAAEARLRRGDVRLVAVSGVSNVTGAVAPVGELCALAHAARAGLLVDAAQAIGWIPLELESSGVDVAAFGAHKGTQGVWGIGALYVREGYRLESPRAGGALGGPGWCDAGSLDRPALEGWAAGLRWLDAPPRAGRLDRARAKIAELRAALEGWAGVRVLGPRSEARRTPVLALVVSGRAPSDLASALRASGIQVSGGLQCAPLAHRALGTLDLGGALRLSVGPEPDAVDVGEVLRGLRSALG